MNTPTPRTDEFEALRDAMSTRASADYFAALQLCDKLERELTAVTEQRDSLAVALKIITTFDYADLQCDNGHGPIFVATEALQSLTQDHFPDVGNMIGTTTTEP